MMRHDIKKKTSKREDLTKVKEYRVEEDKEGIEDGIHEEGRKVLASSLIIECLSNQRKYMVQ